MKIVLTGGGTGGHVIPNLSLLPYLKKDFEIFYIGSNGIEKELVKKYDYLKFYEISTPKVNREKVLKNLMLPFKLLGAVSSCSKILDEIKPDIVFSKGGYVSVPVCLAAYFKKIPIVSHESDLTMGVANKLIYRLSTKFCTTFEKTSRNLKKGVFTGAPIRDELFKGDKKRGIEITGLKANLPYVLFTGGSTGAKAINDVVFNNIATISQKYNVIHLVGKNKGKNIKYQNYFQMEFCGEIEHLYKLADVVVSRAGSGAIYELLRLNKKMLLIPLPKGNSRGDQVENANYFKNKNYARVLAQEDLNIDNLMREIDSLYKDDSIYQLLSTQNSSNGAKNIVNVILNTVKSKEK